MGEGEFRIQQCINCGYVTSEKFHIESTKENNTEFQNLPENMKDWAVESINYIWTPTIMTLPNGMLYPEDVNGDMKWKFAEMIDIPEEEQKNYPIPNRDGEFYKRTYDVDNSKVYDIFFDAMYEINEKIKNDTSKSVDVNLPKLKKVD